MPTPLLRPCAAPGGCPALVAEGSLCPMHRREREHRRGSARQRGYTSRWEWFRRKVSRAMVRAGIAPVCGASLPGGPDLSTVSRCRSTGVLNDRQLELHHDPPLTEVERHDQDAVCDPRRVGWLCHRCHSAETARARALEWR